jgi:hypothetical protein
VLSFLRCLPLASSLGHKAEREEQKAETKPTNRDELMAARRMMMNEALAHV